jgi:hypothetical protein
MGHLNNDELRGLVYLSAFPPSFLPPRATVDGQIHLILYANMGIYNGLVAALASLPMALASPTARQSCSVLTENEVSSMGNNSLFTRWRPYSHFNAPAGWMNDPCGPMYDPTRDIYHIFYQWHPQHINCAYTHIVFYSASNIASQGV